MRSRQPYVFAVAIFGGVLFAAAASGFIITPSDPDPWLSTASGPRAGNGAPATITWSIVPDGTTAIRNTTTSATAPSNLISFMNTNFGGNAAQSNLALQPWFPIFEDSFGRWSQLSSVNFVYESHDDGVFHPSSNGVLGVRGDIRLGGADLNGTGTLAFTYVTTGGSDMMIDTTESAFFKQSPNFVNFRDTLMHEIGHGFGLQHVATSSALLMEPFIDTSMTRPDGPQLDEVRGVQFFFGDVNEKSHSGLGNGTFARATGLGTIAPGGTKSVGVAANVPSQVISAMATDFVSISNVDDTDYYSFTVSAPSQMGAILTPRGGVFTQGAADFNETPTTFNANARNNLELKLFSTNGLSVLATVNANPAGGIESIANLVLPAAGTYFARVMGVDDTVQLYELSLTATPILVGDYNKNGVVDAADYAVWRNTQGTSVALGTGADGNFDGQITTADYGVWRLHFGETATPGSGFSSGTAVLATSSAVPEPISLWLLMLGCFGFSVVARRWNRRISTP